MGRKRKEPEIKEPTMNETPEKSEAIYHTEPLGMETIPPVENDPIAAAHQALWRAQQFLDLLTKELNSVMMSPIAKKLRDSAVDEKFPLPGDAKSWVPLKTIAGVLRRMGSLRGS